jgi:hypothetical protein
MTIRLLHALPLRPFIGGQLFLSLIMLLSDADHNDLSETTDSQSPDRLSVRVDVAQRRDSRYVNPLPQSALSAGRSLF